MKRCCARRHLKYKIKQNWMQGWHYGKGLIYYRPINKSALCRSTSPAFSFVFNGVACWPGPVPLFFIFWSKYLISGTKRYGDFRETGPYVLSPKSNQERIKGLSWSNYMSLVRNNFSFNSVQNRKLSLLFGSNGEINGRILYQRQKAKWSYSRYPPSLHAP